MGVEETMTFSGSLEEYVDQLRDVFFALTKRRDPQGHNREPVVKVFTKGGVLNHGGEVTVGGGDDADVDVDGSSGADLGEVSFLENAKELDLNFQGELTDFVKEEGSTIGRFDDARLAGQSSGKGAANMAEEFRFDEIRRNSTAVDGDEGAVATAAIVMNRPSDKLLAGTGFALNENSCLTLRDARGLIQDAEETFGVTNDLFESVAFV
jgi:hypothetical protein